jgi:hypothetical protein
MPPDSFSQAPRPADHVRVDRSTAFVIRFFVFVCARFSEVQKNGSTPFSLPALVPRELSDSTSSLGLEEGYQTFLQGSLYQSACSFARNYRLTGLELLGVTIISCVGRLKLLAHFCFVSQGISHGRTSTLLARGAAGAA